MAEKFTTRISKPGPKSRLWRVVRRTTSGSQILTFIGTGESFEEAKGDMLLKQDAYHERKAAIKDMKDKDIPF